MEEKEFKFSSHSKNHNSFTHAAFDTTALCKKNLIIRHNVEKWLVGWERQWEGRYDGDEGDVSSKIMSTKEMYIFYVELWYIKIHFNIVSFNSSYTL